MKKLVLTTISTLAFFATINISAANLTDTNNVVLASAVIELPDEASTERYTFGSEQDFFTESEGLRLIDYDENLDEATEYPESY
ncbi:MAG: hypothetical protein HOO06_13550 [Bdellovibrionaceae bacterium]|jgi:hypothetical protein|nr:hypothetical protein [Pseudobdellovibrionaceae bacterium]